jgi:hypothetical protein
MPTAARIPARRRSGRRLGLPVAAVAALALLPLAGPDAAGDLGVGDALVTMRVGGGAISGRGPCNDYRGPLGDAGDGMLAGVVPGTLPCGDGGLEARYLQDLVRVSSLEVEDGHLVASGGDVRLEYAERSRR